MFPILNPPPSPYHPSGSSQCTSPKHPVSCIEPGLATRFIHDILHVSMPFNQIFPPSPFPSPTESIRLFYTSVSLLLSRAPGYCYHLSKFHIYALVYCSILYWCFSFWLTSLCIIGSSFSLPGDISRGKRSSMPQRRDSSRRVPALSASRWCG